MNASRLSVIDSILREVCAVAEGYVGLILWEGAWIPQDALCLEISYQLSKLLEARP